MLGHHGGRQHYPDLDLRTGRRHAAGSAAGRRIPRWVGALPITVLVLFAGVVVFIALFMGQERQEFVLSSRRTWRTRSERSQVRRSDQPRRERRRMLHGASTVSVSRGSLGCMCGRYAPTAGRSNLLEHVVVDDKNADELRGQDYNVTDQD